MLCATELLPEKVSAAVPVSASVALALAVLLAEGAALPVADWEPVGTGDAEGEREGASREARGDTDGEADSCAVVLLQGVV
jgi:hypothetical protein